MNAELVHDILQALQEQPRTIQQISDAVGDHASYKQVYRYVSRLQEDGYVQTAFLRVDGDITDGVKLTENGREALQKNAGAEGDTSG